MPVVPRFQNTVAPGGLPAARMNATPSADDLGAGVGREIGRIGQAMFGIAQKEQEKADLTAVMSAERELQSWQNQALFAPDTGAFARRGSEALGLPDELLPEWDRRVGEIGSRLSARQRAVLDERAGRMRLSMEQDLMRHVGREAEAFQKAETQALVTTRLETAQLYWNNPERFETELREAQEAYLVGNDGLPPAAMQLGLLEIESKGRAGVIQQMIAQNPLEAQRYYDTYRDRLTAADAAAVERVLAPARVDAEAERYVDRAMGYVIDPIGTPEDFTTYRRMLESSGGDPVAKNPKSSAYGADQFIDSTWLQMVREEQPAWAEGLSRDEILAQRADPEKSGQMADALARKNAAGLREAGVPVTNETLYAAHHFGLSRAVAFAKAAPDARAEDIFPAEVIRANDYLKGKTRDEIIANWAQRAGAEPSREPLAPPATKAEALARLNEIPDPDVRRAAIAKYRTRMEIEDIARAETANAMTENINAKVEAADPTQGLRDVLTPAEYAWAAENGKLPVWERRMADRLAGTEPVTAPATFDRLQALFMRAEQGDAEAIKEVRQMDVTQMFTEMGRRDREHFHARRAAIIEAVTKGSQEKMIDYATENELLDTEVFPKLGISRTPGKKESEDDAALRMQFTQQYWSEVDRRQTELGRKLASAERRQIMQELMLPFARTVRDQSILSRINPLDDNLTEEQARAFQIGDVPPIDRQQIAEAYRELNGVEPSEAQIRAYYLRAQGWNPQLESM